MARLAQIRTSSRLFFYTTMAIVLSLCAAVASAAGRDHGILEVRIKDHRDAIGDFTRLNIIIDRILISPRPGLRIWHTGWKELEPSPAAVDLTRYIDKKTARVFRGPIDDGVFEAFHLKLESIEGVAKKDQKTAPVKNTVGPVKLIFEVPSKGETLLVVDLVVTDFSDHPPRGYELSIRGLELFTNGKRITKIPPG